MEDKEEHKIIVSFDQCYLVFDSDPHTTIRVVQLDGGRRILRASQHYEIPNLPCVPRIMTGLIQYVMNKYDSTLDECLREADYTEEIFALSLIQHHFPNVDFTRVCVVNNVFLRALYELKKEEYKSRFGSVTQMTLIHATSERNVDNIIQNNFDWRLVRRNKYGVGISFTEDADYANYHSNPENGDGRAFVVSLVLMHSNCRGSYGLVLPSHGADTAVSDTNKVYVKFNDNEFLPLFVVYYNAPDKTQSKHHMFNKRHGRHRQHSLTFL